MAEEKLKAVIAHLKKKNHAHSFFKSILYSVYEDVVSVCVVFGFFCLVFLFGFFCLLCSVCITSQDSYSGIVTTPSIVMSWMQMSVPRSSQQQSVAASNVYLASATERIVSKCGWTLGCHCSRVRLLQNSCRVRES